MSFGDKKYACEFVGNEIRVFRSITLTDDGARNLREVAAACGYTVNEYLENVETYLDEQSDEETADEWNSMTAQKCSATILGWAFSWKKGVERGWDAGDFDSVEAIRERLLPYIADVGLEKFDEICDAAVARDGSRCAALCDEFWEHIEAWSYTHEQAVELGRAT